jgi:spermidine/putrescine transport system ATP-binding protein
MPPASQWPAEWQLLTVALVSRETTAGPPKPGGVTVGRCGTVTVVLEDCLADAVFATCPAVAHVSDNQPPRATPSVADAGSPAVAVAARGLVKRFGRVTALDRVSVAIRRGEFFSLLGPSGCGKTTLLRVIAGLEHPDEGTLHLSGRDALSVPAHQRPVNTVFQSYALFPHLSVADNVAFGLRMKRRSASEIASRSRAVMDLTQIADLSTRLPAQLSGGQKQRVALARALVNEPEVLLLDEPLGALDLKLRQQLQTELRALQRRLGITFVHVTHDQTEALALSDRMAVMNRGQIEQLGEPNDLYERPRTRFVAEFLGACNLIPGRWQTDSAGAVVATTELGPLRVSRTNPPAPSGAPVTLAIRPEKVQLARPEEAGRLNGVRALVASLLYAGAETRLTLRVGNLSLTASRMNGVSPVPGRAVGEPVLVTLPPEALVVLED